MNYTHIKTTKTENSEIEITGEISLEALTKYRNRALKEINLEISIPGFRKGHIPEKVLLEKVGEMYVLQDAGEMALKDIAPELIEKEAPNYIGRPQISITKLAPGTPIEFKITVAVMPEVKLPDYKKIASKVMSEKEESIEVTDKEIEDVIEQIRKQEAHRSYHATETPKRIAEMNKTQEEKAQQEKSLGENEHKHSEEEIAKHMPELTDEFVKKLGDFKDVTDFKAKVRENTTKEKEFRNKEKKRMKLLEKLVEETTFKLPAAIIDNEIMRMFAQFEGDIKKIGLSVEDYLKHIKKTPEDLRKEWMPDAEKRAKLNVILEKIAQEEKITPDQEEVQKEVAHLLQHYKEVNKVQAQAYTEHMFTIEKTIKFLEDQK